MQKIFLVALLMLCYLTHSRAQNRLPPAFEWDIITLNFASPFGDQSQRKSSLGLGSEARYNLSQQFSLAAAFKRVNFSTKLADLAPGAVTILTGACDYYSKSDHNIRAFVGLGISAIRNGKSSSITGSLENAKTQAISSFGICPRIGIEFHQIRVLLDFQYSLKADVLNVFGISTAYTIQSKSQ